MKTMNAKQIDMTQGDIFPAIIAFAVPLLIGSFLQTFYNTVDSIIIGQFVSTDALAAVGACNSPMMLLQAIMLGLSSGMTVLISQMIGVGHMDKVKEAVSTVNSFFVLSVIPITLMALLLVNPLLSFIDIPDSSRSSAFQYLIIVFGGLIGSFGYNLNSGLLRGLGDSRSPLIFLLIACLVNIVLDLMFVLLLNWGVFGVAIATIIAQMVSWLYSQWHIKKHYPFLDYKLFRIAINPVHFKRFMTLSATMVCNHAVFSLGYLLFYRFVNGFGPVFMAGYSIAGKIENIIWLPVSSLGTAAVTFAGQNCGAGNPRNIKKGTKIILRTAVIFNVAASMIGLIFGRKLLGLFTPDAAVVEAGYLYLKCLNPFYWIYAFIHILGCIMNGVGDVKIPTISSMVMFWGVRLPVAWYFSTHFSESVLYYCFPISWVAGVTITASYYLSGRWKQKVPQGNYEKV